MKNKISFLVQKLLFIAAAFIFFTDAQGQDYNKLHFESILLTHIMIL